ncbi:hypothetical protein Q1695_014465 [Nippostrongylus brasiliensis]|nr:hypothetical protein Q1695_014465 [Nippostrongylus brasiliensis]
MWRVARPSGPARSIDTYVLAAVVRNLHIGHLETFPALGQPALGAWLFARAASNPISGAPWLAQIVAALIFTTTTTGDPRHPRLSADVGLGGGLSKNEEDVNGRCGATI